MTRKGFDAALTTAALVVVVPLGLIGLHRADSHGGGAPAGVTVQMGRTIEGHVPGNFHPDVVLDTTQVGEGR